jgi:hypothetical protein
VNSNITPKKIENPSLKKRQISSKKISLFVAKMTKKRFLGDQKGFLPAERRQKIWGIRKLLYNLTI